MMKKKKCAGCRKQNCDGCSLSAGSKVTNAKNRGILLPPDFLPEKQAGLGLAFDIGTTTVAGMLFDLETGKQLGVETCINPQRKFGADVISRIAFGVSGKEKQKKLQQLLVEKMDELARQLLTDTAENQSDIDAVKAIEKVTAVGNTAMCEILAGCDLTGLAKAPFQKAYQGSLSVKGERLGFVFLKEAKIIILPSIEGYAGADALSVSVWVKHQDNRKKLLAVDIGTNGEMLLIGKEKTYVCSAAAGPALEGAAVEQGMGAAPGAVEGVVLAGSFPREDVFCKVIGGCEPKGICGSGLVDALALLKRLGVIEKTGCLLTRQEAAKAGIRERICRRISERNGEACFLLTDEENPVYLTAGDIRQLQLAKGAIRAGIEVLLEKAECRIEEINHIYLAGAFGSYIDIENAKEIGLLPAVSREMITHTGNCAGAGAVMALLSQKTAEEMEQSADEIIHIDLAQTESFPQLFMEYLNF